MLRAPRAHCVCTALHLGHACTGLSHVTILVQNLVPVPIGRQALAIQRSRRVVNIALPLVSVSSTMFLAMDRVTLPRPSTRLVLSVLIVFGAVRLGFAKPQAPRVKPAARLLPLTEQRTAQRRRLASGALQLGYAMSKQSYAIRRVSLSLSTLLVVVSA